MRELVRAMLGAECLLEPAAAMQYAVHGRTPAVVVAPRSSEQAAALLQLATREGLAVECAGAATRLSAGNAPQRLDIVLTSAALTAVTEYEPADLVISVSAGASLAQINELVAPHKQFLALDPAVSRRSTVGSTVAAGSAGPLRFAHGTPRDQVLGIEVVTGDGRVLHFGGRVVKNVAGYDVVRLMVGSRGTLAFITQVSLRLKPRPEIDRTAVVSAQSFAAIADVADALFATRLDAAAIEIVSEPLARRVAGVTGWALLARLHGNDEAVADGIERVRVAAGSAQVGIAGSECWSELASTEAAAPVKLRLANLRSALRDSAATALRAAEAARLADAQIAMHAGDGIVRVLAAQTASSALDAVVRARGEMEDAGGTLIVECMPSVNGLDAFGRRSNASLLSGLKHVFDPAGILGSGRLVA